MQVGPLVRNLALHSIILGISLLIFADAPGAQTAVYRCADRNGWVYSDLPCDDEAIPHEIDNSRVTVYTPLKITSNPPAERASSPVPARQPKEKRARRSAGADPLAQRIKCLRLDQKLRDLRTRMRTGYGVQEGERLKARQRQLKDQRRAARCR